MPGKLRNFAARLLKSSLASLWRPLHSGMELVKHPGYMAGKVAILCYHRIVADIVQAERGTPIGMVTSADTFRRQMKLIRKHYDALPLAEAVAVLRGERKAARRV